jgi:cell division septation protein DedD
VLATAWRRRFRRYPGDWIWPVLGLLIIAALAAAVGILATNGNGSAAQTRAETQPSVPLSTGTLPTATETSTLPTESVPTTAPNTLTEWPAGQDGWTIVLSSIPQSAGRANAVDAARKALNAGVTDVGILNSSEYSSLHAGYFVVFSGVFTSEADARAALDNAQGSYPQSYVRQITQ